MAQTSPAYAPYLLPGGMAEAACTCGWRTNRPMTPTLAASAWRAHCGRDHP